MSIINSLINNPLGFLASMLYRAPAILIALTLHELSHGYVAYLLGDPTAKLAGRLSLNPLKHLEPMGTIMLLFLGFGWAKPVPVNPNNFKNFRRDDTLVSLAGVTMNFILFTITLGVYVLWYFLWPHNEIIMTFMEYFMSINLYLAIFNLLPIPPMDGFHVVNNIFFKGRLQITGQIAQICMISVLALSFFGILGQVLSVAFNFVFDGMQWLFINLYYHLGLLG